MPAMHYSRRFFIFTEPNGLNRARVLDSENITVNIEEIMGYLCMIVRLRIYNRDFFKQMW